MDKFTQNIISANKAICDNIEKREALNNDGLLAQNIIAHLRNFVEAIALKIYSIDHEVDLNQDGTKQAIKYIKGQDSLSFLRRFHKRLEVTASHLTVEPDASLRLMWRYYDYLIDCKDYLKKQFDLDVLSNIDKFPLEEDKTLKEYYQKIAIEVTNTPNVIITESPTNRFYILKKKPFRVNGQKYYEITLSEADNKISKFDRFIAFTNLNIPSYYAVHLRFNETTINIINRDMSIRIIMGYKVSTRPCEFDNFFRLIGHTTKIATNNAEYRELMNYLTLTGSNLTELLEIDDDDFTKIRNTICKRISSTPIFDGLVKCRNLYDKSGYNILTYLLYRLNNTILKAQYCYKQNNYLSNLYLRNQCIPFDKMPYANNLAKHITILFDLYDCVSPVGREHELLARKIKTNTEINAKLYTPVKELEKFSNLEILIEKYNSKLYSGHREDSSLKLENGFLFISGYENNTVSILKTLLSLAKERIVGFTDSVNDWFTKSSYKIDDDCKREALKNMFSNSKVALICGSAGTGKTTMLKHVSNFFIDKSKIYLSNTHAAVENLRRNVGNVGTTTFSTIRSYLSERGEPSCDILFIDECSTVSNEDMKKVLEKTNFKLLVLAGDIYQIESIKFGNWFYISKINLPQNCVHELNYIHRSTAHDLRSLWKSVRNLDDRMSDIMELNNFCSSMDESIFEKLDNDEIILCLNYDGLYGINNINKFLQDNNTGKCVQIGLERYKVNDPIIFKETTLYNKYLYNNLKGRIVDFIEIKNKIIFSIEVDKVFNSFDIEDAPFELKEPLNEGKSVVSFSVDRFVNRDDDDRSDYNIVPFQVAYAVSIHKAQGLEYESVKIIITDEIEELISHNIFYTAITRAKKKLKIYWTKQAEQYILDNMHFMYNNQDASILFQKYKLI